MPPAPKAQEASSLADALLDFQREIPKLQKDSINPHFRNKYIGLDSLMQQVLPVLSKHGIVLTQSPSFTQVDTALVPTLVTTLTHPSSGGAVSTEMLLMHAKDDPQGQGSAITYARRYSLMALLGLVADEDDDGNAGSQSTGQQTRQVTTIGGAL